MYSFFPCTVIIGSYIYAQSSRLLGVLVGHCQVVRVVSVRVGREGWVGGWVRDRLFR